MISKYVQIEQDARAFGFEWPDINMIFDQIESECEEIKDAIANNESRDRIQEEIGDLIATSIGLCLFAGFDVEETLGKVSKKFGSRMEILKKLTKERGLESLKGKSIDICLELWHEVKKLEKGKRS